MSNQVQIVYSQSTPTTVELVAPGPQGPAGEDGVAGPAGVGSAWRQGAGAPGSGVGVDGDYYLNTSNGDIYGPKAAGAWGAVIFNIAEGQAGPSGVANATAPITYDAGTQTVAITPATTTAAGSMSAADKTKLDGVAGGATANATDAQLRDRATHTGTQSASTITGLATVATSGAYSDLTGRPTLGTAAATDASAYATAAQGAKADTAVQPAALSSYVTTGDSRLTDAREWSAATIDQAEAETGTATTRRAFTAQRVFQAIAAWWAGSSAKTKLDGIATGATANSTDAQLRDRATHTGTQAASTITGLGTAAALNTGTSAGNVVVLDGSARLPAVDGSQLTDLPPGVPAGGTTGQVLAKASATNYDTAWQTLGAGSSAANYQEFTSSGTWTKPAGATMVYVEAIGGGGGGGSGRRGAVGTNRNGGGGGSSAKFVARWLSAETCGSTETVTVGAGGTGGGARTTDDTDGAAGNGGGSSSFGGLVVAVASSSGAGGTSAAGGTGGAVANYGASTNGLFGANGATGGTTSVTTAIRCSLGPGGGGGAGGISSANAVGIGAAGGQGFSEQKNTGNASSTFGGGGTNGSGDGGNGGNGPTYGDGGGGGARGSATNAGAGGNGAFPGGGGGGGGASTNGFNSGAGGNGGAGVVRIWCW